MYKKKVEHELRSFSYIGNMMSSFYYVYALEGTHEVKILETYYKTTLILSDSVCKPPSD